MNPLCILCFLFIYVEASVVLHVHTCSMFLWLFQILQPFLTDFVFTECNVCMRVCTHAYYVGFDVLTVVTMKNIILWNVTSYSQVEFHRRFGGMYCFHLQGLQTTGLHGATSLKIILFDDHSNLCISINIVRKNKSWSMRWAGHVYCYM
jgi:hypothetical protein